MIVASGEEYRDRFQPAADEMSVTNETKEDH